MKPKTFYSLRSLLAHADKLLADVDTVTIDLFDTIVIRRIHDPDNIKPAVARYIALMAEGRGINGWAWEKVQALRDRFEVEQRAETAQHFEDHEARYPDYMGRVLGEIFGRQMEPDLLEMVTDYEMEIESAMIVPRAALATWIKEIAKTKRVIIVSDIYLPSDLLKRLVDRTGLLPYVEDVVSSADTFLAKASGKAFALLEKRYGLTVSRWLHIGDNPFSDGLRPAACGIRSLVLKDIKEIQRKTLVKLYAKFAVARPFWKGRLLQQLMLPLEAENIPRSRRYIEGYTFFGFLIGFFTQHILEQCQQRGIDRVYFFSREGWTFQTYWKRAIPLLAPENCRPQCHYLLASRLALAGASCSHSGIDEDKARIAFLNPGNRDMRDFCRVFSFDVAVFSKILDRFALAKTMPISPLYSRKGYARFKRMLKADTFQALVKSQARPHNEALQVYLESIGFFSSPKVALVDVGWMGNIQRFLFDAVKHRDDCPDFNGFLLAASRGIPYPASDKNHIEGVLYDRAWAKDFAGSTILYNRDLFEEVCRAPHPSMIGYQLDQEQLRFEFRGDKDHYGAAEAVQDEYFFPLRWGIMDAALRYAAATAVLGFSVKSMRPWLRYLMVTKIAFPKTKEVAVLKYRHHMDDFGGKHKPPKKAVEDEKHLWDQPLWKFRFWPGMRSHFYLKKKRPF
jgi:FMN phosphatase YigB (HAD superfamily)